MPHAARLSILLPCQWVGVVRLSLGAATLVVGLSSSCTDTPAPPPSSCTCCLLANKYN